MICLFVVEPLLRLVIVLLISEEEARIDLGLGLARRCARLPRAQPAAAAATTAQQVRNVGGVAAHRGTAETALLGPRVEEAVGVVVFSKLGVGMRIAVLGFAGCAI